MMKMKDEEEFPTFCAGCEMGKIEINLDPRFPSVKIAPLKGRQICLTGDAARLLLSFMCKMIEVDNDFAQIHGEHTDDISYIC